MQHFLIFLTLLGAATSLRLQPQLGASKLKSKQQAERNALGFPSMDKVLEKHANNKKEIIITFGNEGRLDFTLNFVAHLRRLKIDNYLVGAIDEGASRKLRARGVPTFDAFSETDESSKMSGETGWGSKAFYATGAVRAAIVKEVLDLGYTMLLCDNDVVILRDPFPFFSHFPEADILTSTDAFGTTANNGLETQPNHDQFNVGNMLLKPSAKELASDWFTEVAKGGKDSWDQRVFNNLVRGTKSRLTAQGPDSPLVQKWLKKTLNSNSSSPLFTVDKYQLSIGVLPVSHFCNGHTAFVQQMWEHTSQALEGPYMIHSTYAFGSTKAKIHRLREAKLWLVDPPSYYDQPILTYKHVTNAPPLGSLGQQMPVEDHFKIMNPQLTQIRDSLILSMSLGRRLVLPKMVCGSDRWWNIHKGVIPGTSLTLPYSPCPADQVFELDRLAMEEGALDIDSSPEQNVKYQISDSHVREHSFLENEHFHARKTVTPTMPEEGASIDRWKVFIESLRHTASNEVLHLERVPNYKIVLDALYPSNGDSKQKQQRDKFTKLLQKLTGSWCCTAKGGIHYNLLNDEL